MHWIRDVGAVLTGVVAGSCFNMCVIHVNTNVFYPLPAGVDMNNPQEIRSYIANWPIPAFLILFLAHYGQAWLGGHVAVRVGRRWKAAQPMIMAQAVALLTMIGSIIANLSLRGVLPAWTWLEIPVFPIIGWMVGRYYSDGHSRFTNATTARRKE